MSKNLANERREAIAARLDDGLAVVAASLAAEFGVSEDSIRRDLRALAAEGRCRRVYGGASPPAQAQTSMTARIGENRERKLALARAGVGLIRQGEFLFLDNGSTNLALASLLPGDLNLTAATNSAAIAAALCGRPGLRLILIGGTVDPDVGGCVDAAAVLTLQQMTFDHCFLGVCALSAEGGSSAFDGADAVFKRVLLAASRRTSALVLTDKLNLTAPHRVAPLSRMETLVLEHDAPQEDRAALAGEGPRLLLAAPPER